LLIPEYLVPNANGDGWDDLRFPYGGTIGANAMRAKDAYVRSYFKANLKIDLE
jgi:hypothetical protein